MGNAVTVVGHFNANEAAIVGEHHADEFVAGDKESKLRKFAIEMSLNPNAPLDDPADEAKDSKDKDATKTAAAATGSAVEGK